MCWTASLPSLARAARNTAFLARAWSGHICRAVCGPLRLGAKGDFRQGCKNQGGQKGAGPVAVSRPVWPHCGGGSAHSALAVSKQSHGPWALVIARRICVFLGGVISGWLSRLNRASTRSHRHVFPSATQIQINISRPVECISYVSSNLWYSVTAFSKTSGMDYYGRDKTRIVLTGLFKAAHIRPPVTAPCPGSLRPHDF